MKNLLLPIFLLAPALTLSARDSVPAEAAEGSLKVGYGVIVEISGILADDSDTKLRRDLGRTLLLVKEVAGKGVKETIYLPLETFTFHPIKFPPRGTRVTLRGYQAGAHSGIPNAAFEDIPMVATERFHFATYFMVTALLKKEANPPPEPIPLKRDGPP